MAYVNMNKFVLILIIGMTIISTTVRAQRLGVAVNLTDDQPWLWGYAENLTTSDTESGTVKNTGSPREVQFVALDKGDPCEPITPVMPNFTRPWRRKSQTKCYEYMWGIKTRDDLYLRMIRCEQQRIHIANMELISQGLNPIDGILRGRDARAGEYPHMAAVAWKSVKDDSWVFLCGGSLISNKYVLTAAHCTYTTGYADPHPQLVRLGDRGILYSNILTKDVNISKIIIHPQYKSPKKYYDIALLELAEEVEFTRFIQPACLWYKDDLQDLGREGTITGWGVVNTDTNKRGQFLQTAVVDLINSSTCDQLLRSRCNRKFCGIRDHQTCAGKLDGGADACQGDSGGPIQVRIMLPTEPEYEVALHYVFGVTSFGIGCGLANLPGVYTRVSSFIDWIEDNIWK